MGAGTEGGCRQESGWILNHPIEAEWPPVAGDAWKEDTSVRWLQFSSSSSREQGEEGAGWLQGTVTGSSSSQEMLPPFHLHSRIYDAQ